MHNGSTYAGSAYASVRKAIAPYVFLAIALAIECAVFEVVARHKEVPPFLSLDCLILVLDHSAVYGVLSVGMTLVILTGGIDLSVGSLIALGGVICAKVVHFGGESALYLVLGWAAALAAGALTGGVAGAFITRFAIPPFIATLAIMSSARGLGFLVTGGQSVSDLPALYTLLGRGRLAERIPVGIFVMLGAFVLGMILLEHTRFGRHIRAIGGNEESARLSGVPVARVKWATYAVCGALATLGGLILSSKLGSGDPKAGLGDELEVIAAVVVGGTSLSGGRGSLFGTFMGLILIAVLRTGLNWVAVQSFTQQVILGGVILAAVLLDRFKTAR